ncbi:hypothetical protein ASG82_19270 [Mycobacterium sp. Soil538]|nr:hypothetical protein ASG82_19270 [Mycobacterium sp. Soil538]
MEGVFLGTEALASGALTRHQLRTRYRRVLPDVYVPARAELTLLRRAAAAWLWSGRQGIVSGLAASALWGAKWVDDNAVIELNWPNHRAPPGVLTRNDTLLDDEIAHGGLPVTTPERTAFDLARQGSEVQAVARLDALARATHFKVDDVRRLAQRHPHVRHLRRVDRVLGWVDAGAESPQESRVRMMLVRAGYPQPATQIPVLAPDGYPGYYLDMGWEGLDVAVEYDGQHHREDDKTYRKDIIRLEYLASVGWIVVRVVKGDRQAEILQRVQRAVIARGGF